MVLQRRVLLSQITSIQVLYVTNADKPHLKKLHIHINPSYQKALKPNLISLTVIENKSAYHYIWSRCTEILSNSLVPRFPCGAQ